MGFCILLFAEETISVFLKKLECSKLMVSVNEDLYKDNLLLNDYRLIIKRLLINIAH